MKAFVCLAMGLVWALAGCGGMGTDEVVQRTYNRVGDHRELSYHFINIDHKSSDSDYEIVGPVHLHDSTRPGAYRVQSYGPSRSSQTGIVFYPRIEAWESLRHDHPPADKIFRPVVADITGDSSEELVIIYLSHDSLILEAVDVHTDDSIYRRVLVVGRDANGDGRWDAQGTIAALQDINGDGHDDCIVACNVGLDLYPRQVMCLDWYHDSLLWTYPIAGAMGTLEIVPTGDHREHTIVFSISSKGNRAVANDMDDHHSYLVGLDYQGHELFRRQLGGKFTTGFIGQIDYESDGLTDIVVGYRKCPQGGPAVGIKPCGGIMMVIDVTGRPLDSIDLGPGKSFRSMTVNDFDGDGKDDILASFSDSTIIQYNTKLQAVTIGKFYTHGVLLPPDDFLGTGRKQMAVVMNDNSLCLIDDQFHLLAQIDIGLHPGWTQTYPHPNGGLNIVGTSQTNQGFVYLIGLEKTSWMVMLYHKYKQSLLLVAVALLVALIVSLMYQRRVRRHLILIARQKEDLEKAHRQVRAMQAKVIAAEKHRQAKVIAGGVAHEIHNALCPAANALDLLKNVLPKATGDDISPERLIALSEQAIDRAMRMTSLVTEYSRLEATRKKESVPLKPVLQTIADELTVAPDGSALNISMGVPDTYAIACSQTHAHALFGNVLKNAVEAMAASSRKEINITASENEAHISIEITDTGPGLPDDIREHIFEPFVTSRPNNGTGLGLTIARRIVELYNGHITIENRLDGGAKCCILMPKSSPVTRDKMV